jgi:tripartite-type tricarboxylate transporter receptor subunit TctC
MGDRINPAIQRRLPYDTLRDFAAIVQVSSGGGYLLAVKNDFPAKTVGELVAFAKRPGKSLTYGSSGLGNSAHLAGALLAVKAGIDLLHVPYKSGGSLTTALIGGEIDLLFLTPVAAKPFVKSGQIRILGIAEARRSPQLPDVPTIAEAGVPDCEYAAGWNGLFAPSRTPRTVITRLGDAFRKALADPSVKERLTAIGAEPIGSTSEEFEQIIRKEIQTNLQIVKVAKIEMQQ